LPVPGFAFVFSSLFFSNDFPDKRKFFLSGEISNFAPWGANAGVKSTYGVAGLDTGVRTGRGVEDPMSGAARKYDQDYWRPPRSADYTGAEEHVSAPAAMACPECGTEFIVGARYCHVCGGERRLSGEQPRGFLEMVDFDRIRQAIGLPTASLVCLGLGIAFAVAAIVTGLIYTANTVLDWQAVQVWRIEWLLAAAVAFVAGILLKPSSAK
jgi:hypothetical protein